MLWRKAYETAQLALDDLDIPIGLPEDCAYLCGRLSRWSEMLLWEKLLQDSGMPIWFGVEADASMAQAVIPRSRLERVLLISNAGDEVIAVAVRNGQPKLALQGQATESALDLFLEALS